MTAGSVALAMPSWAGDIGQQLEAEVAPEVAAPGDSVTVTSIDPCPAGTSGPASWIYENLDSGEGFEGDAIEVDEDGNWSVTFEAPAELGEYVFETSCEPPEECYEVEAEQLRTDTTEPDCHEYYYQVFFTVEEADTLPTTPTTEPPVTTPPPATPIEAPPTNTG